MLENLTVSMFFLSGSKNEMLIDKQDVECWDHVDTVDATTCSEFIQDWCNHTIIISTLLVNVIYIIFLHFAKLSNQISFKLLASA